jgi:YfiR/HmsC-like
MSNAKTILGFLGFMCFVNTFGQNEKFKALFIYNFTNYIEWPGGNKSFVITILGESPIIGELKAISKIKKVGSLPIEVQKINSSGEVGSAQIVYVPASMKKNLPEITKSLSGKPVLIISDGAQGEFGINFIEVDQKQSFQISKLNMELRKLKVNSALLALGIPVN